MSTTLGSMERLVFGEWLVKAGRLEQSILRVALETQNAESSDTLRSSPRMLGQILLDDHHVFRNRLELNQSLMEFEKVKAAIVQRKQELNIDDLPPAKPVKRSSVGKVSIGPTKPAEERSLFGQFLIEKRKINAALLEKALDIQNMETKENLRESHRLLGEILMDDFNVFRNRVELNRLLIEFNDFKARLEAQRTELMYIQRSED